MSGFLHHLRLTLKLNFRSKQALVFGYLVPLFFLLAFGSVFKESVPPITRQLGELLTISVLGGACFGMPTAMVAERERGVWRRYRLLPATTGLFIASTMLARFVIILSAALLQIALAMGYYKMPAPEHPAQLAVAFTFVCFSFMGLGLVIAMLADSVPAVQALGQSVFLPMIMIGGVGVPLRQLPVWVQHVAAFLPGRYAVESLQSCVDKGSPGLNAAHFALLALTIIGLAACLAGAKLFRWDVGQKVPARTKLWLAPALAAWVLVGIGAEVSGYVGRRVVFAAVGPDANKIEPSPTTAAPAPSTTQSATAPASASAAIATTLASTATTTLPAPAVTTTRPASSPAGDPWNAITDVDVKKITFTDLDPDSSTVTPIAQNLDNLEDEGKKRLEAFNGKLAEWKPGNEADLGQRVRNLLSAAAVADIAQDQFEGEIAYSVLDQIKSDIPREKLIKILTWICLNPNEGKVLTEIKDLGVDGEATEEGVRDRAERYGRKLLGQLTDRWPPKP